MVRRPLKQSLCAVLMVGALSWGMVACGDDPSPDTAATPTAPSACADLAALKDSLGSLKDVDLKQDGVEALTSAIGEVKADFATARSSVSTALKPQIDEVATAVAALQTATSGLTTDNLAEKTPAIKTAIDQLSTALTDLATAVTQSCPED